MWMDGEERVMGVDGWEGEGDECGWMGREEGRKKRKPLL